MPGPAPEPPLLWRRGPVTIAHTIEGAGPTVLAIHGMPGGRRDFRRLAEHLAADVRVVRVDLPGFGDSPPVAGIDTAERAAACLADFLVDLGEPAIVVGHSFGGVIALRLVDRAPERVRGLALLASPGLRPHRIYHRRSAAALAALLDLPGADALLTWPLRQVYRLAGLPTNTTHRSRVLGIRNAAALRFADQRALIDRLRAPTLIAWADDDRLVEAPIVEELAAACPPGPRLRFARAGHNLPGRVPAELAAAIRAWSTELPPARTP